MEGCTLLISGESSRCTPITHAPCRWGLGGSHLAPYLGGAADEVSVTAPSQET